MERSKGTLWSRHVEIMILPEYQMVYLVRYPENMNHDSRCVRGTR
ncbi:hypothetical protein [Anaerobium acetethylicum]|nr:hypothetical protein [Anaerobium acetethylicum]